MSTPLEQQQPPSIGVISQQPYTGRTGHGSLGPVIAVVAVITLLGIIAGMIGKLCSGRPIMGHGRYDFEGWIDTKCSSCLDGTVLEDPPPSRPTVVDEEQVAVPAEETQHEIKEEEEHEKDRVQGQYESGSSSKS